jgi:hypothetical protein
LIQELERKNGAAGTEALNWRMLHEEPMTMPRLKQSLERGGSSVTTGHVYEKILSAALLFPD